MAGAPARAALAAVGAHRRDRRHLAAVRPGAGAGGAGLVTPSFFAVVAQLRLGGRRAQSLVVTVGLLSCSALLVHITGGLNQSYFHFFVMVAALSLYEDWLPFAIAVVLRARAAGDHGGDRRLRRGRTRRGAGRSCTRRSSVRWAWCAWRRGARRTRPRGVPDARRVARGRGADGRPRRAARRGQPERRANPRHGAGAGPGAQRERPGVVVRRRRRRAAARRRAGPCG